MTVVVVAVVVMVVVVVGDMTLELLSVCGDCGDGVGSG